jgi:hypothetical protein
VTLAQLAAMADRAVLKLVKTLRQIQDVHPWWVLRVGEGVLRDGRKVLHLAGMNRNGRCRSGQMRRLRCWCCRIVLFHTCMRVCPLAVGCMCATAVDITGQCS